MFIKIQRQIFLSKDKELTKFADILGHSSVNTARSYTMSTDEVHHRQNRKLGLLRCTEKHL